MMSRYAWVAWIALGAIVAYYIYDYAMSLKRAADVEVMH